MIIVYFFQLTINIHKTCKYYAYSVLMHFKRNLVKNQFKRREIILSNNDLFSFMVKILENQN